MGLPPIKAPLTGIMKNSKFQVKCFPGALPLFRSWGKKLMVSKEITPNPGLSQKSTYINTIELSCGKKFQFFCDDKNFKWQYSALGWQMIIWTNCHVMCLAHGSAYHWRVKGSAMIQLSLNDVREISKNNPRVEYF